MKIFLGKSQGPRHSPARVEAFAPQEHEHAMNDEDIECGCIDPTVSEAPQRQNRGWNSVPL